jgi:hypothetical protein
LDIAAKKDGLFATIEIAPVIKESGGIGKYAITKHRQKE